MARIERFEDIEAWQEARELARSVYETTRKGPFSRDFGLRDQIQRAAVSVLSNIAEGFERHTNKEFIHFLYIAKGSAGEVRAQLYIAEDLAYVDAHTAQELRTKAISVSRRISGFIKYLQHNNHQRDRTKGTH